MMTSSKGRGYEYITGLIWHTVACIKITAYWRTSAKYSLHYSAYSKKVGRQRGSDKKIQLTT